MGWHGLACSFERVYDDPLYSAGATAGGGDSKLAAAINHKESNVFIFGSSGDFVGNF